MVWLSLRGCRGLACAALLGAALAATACKDDGSIRVRSIDFKGVKAIDPEALGNALATQPSSKLPWGKKRYFNRAQFEDDIKRIRAFYADRGYPDARVTGFDIKLNRQQDAVDATVTISEGEPVMVAVVNFSGFDVIPTAHLDGLKKQAIQPGRPRDRQLVLLTRERALDELRDHGYAYASVSVLEDDGPTGREATLTFAAQPGKVARFGAVQIQGNTSVGESVVRRALTFKEGDLYERSRVQDTQRRLYGMELFQFVNVESLDVDQQPVDVPMKITVAEGPHQRVNLGVGYGTEEQARVDGEYHHVNFLGGARTAGAHVRWSSLDRGVQLDFKQPSLFDPHVSLGVEGQQWYSYTPAYRSTTTGAKATATYRVRERTSLAISMTSEHDVSAIASNVLSDLTLRNNLIALGLNPRSGEQVGTLNALGFDAQHSTAGNLADAHSGYYLAFHAEQAGWPAGTFKYTAMSIDGRDYVPLGSRLVLASRLQVANIAAAGGNPDNVPFSKKYFLGGATSIRGWGRYEVSPLSDSGLPIGGDSMVAFSSELRASLRGKVGAVVFIDGGNVGVGSWGVDLNHLRYAAGSGLRYRTPVGSVRLDAGYQLNPIPGLLVNGSPEPRRWRVHFSIGQAF